MTQKRKRSKVEKVRQLLQGGGGVLRENSDDELGDEDHPWEWIYEDEDGAKTKQKTAKTDEHGADGRTIAGARMGSFECRIGDTVLLKAAGNEAWVAIICGLSEGEMEDDDGGMVWEKKATFMWFSSEKEIANNAKKRKDFLPVRASWTTGLALC